MRTISRTLPLLVLLLVLLPSFSATTHAAEWQMLKDSSQLEFFVGYSGQETRGVFRHFETDLNFDPAHPGKGRLVVTVMLQSVDFDSADINTAVAGAEWFDIARHEEAQFVSQTITRTGIDRFTATGVLQLKGIKQSVTVPFSWLETQGLTHVQGELILNRTAFDIGTGEWADSDVIGLKVRVRFSVTLQVTLK